MNRPARVLAAVLAAAALAGCSSFQGQVGKTTETFTDEHGRVCTAVKWGDSASLDCDYAPPGGR